MLLAIDTATPQMSVALRNAGRLVALRRLPPARDHGETLAPLIAAILGDGGLTPAEVTAVAVDVGPGLFTGLRVGLATAQAFAAALRIPAVGLTSLEILAWPHRHEDRLVAAVVDARRKEVFRALRSPGATELSAPAVRTPEDLASELAAFAAPALVVGDGARRYAEVLVREAREAGEAGEGVEIAGEDAAYPDAGDLAEMAAARVAAGNVTNAAGLRPCYLRPPDVRIGWEQRPDPAAARG